MTSEFIKRVLHHQLFFFMMLSSSLICIQFASLLPLISSALFKMFSGSLMIWVIILRDETIDWQEGSNSDRESNDVPKSSRKPQKQSRGKYRLMSKTPDARYPDLLQYQSASSSYGCLSLLKKKRSGGSS